MHAEPEPEPKVPDSVSWQSAPLQERPLDRDQDNSCGRDQPDGGHDDTWIESGLVLAVGASFVVGVEGGVVLLSWLPVNGVVLSPTTLRARLEAGPDGLVVSDPGRSWRRIPADTMSRGVTMIAVPLAAKQIRSVSMRPDCAPAGGLLDRAAGRRKDVLYKEDVPQRLPFLSLTISSFAAPDVP